MTWEREIDIDERLEHTKCYIVSYWVLGWSDCPIVLL